MIQRRDRFQQQSTGQLELRPAETEAVQLGKQAKGSPAERRNDHSGAVRDFAQRRFGRPASRRACPAAGRD